MPQPEVLHEVNVWERWIAVQAIVVPGDPTEELLYHPPGPAGRFDGAGRAGRIGIRRSHALRCGLQGAGPL